MMNCRYCGSSLPTSGGHCPNCGRMIPLDQQKMIRQTIDPRWNTYKNKDTAFYKQNNHKNDEKIGKIIFTLLAILIIIIILVVIKGFG